MPELARWLLAAFALYRLVQFVAIDDGPLDVCDRMRQVAGTYEYGPDGRPLTEWGRVLGCPFCIGLYAAPAFAVLALWPTLPGDIALASLGLAGAQSWLTRPRAWKRRE